MYEIILFPLKGINIVGKGEIILGENIDSVKKKLGESIKINNSEYIFINYELKIETDENNNVIFMECLYGTESIRTRPLIYEKEIFKLKADELINLLLEKSNKNYFIPPKGHLYIFHEISIGIYREFTYLEYIDIIETAKKEGNYNEQKEELYKSLTKSDYFQTIGIGIKDYYKDIIKNSAEQYYE